MNPVANQKETYVSPSCAPAFSPCLANKRKSTSFAGLFFSLLPHLNEFRTVKWQELFNFPETSLNQMRQLLDTPEWVA